MADTAKTYTALFFGPFRVITETKTKVYTFTQESPTVKDLLDKIVTDYHKMKEYLFEGEKLSDNTSIIINGEDIRGGDGLQTLIFPEDRITFFKAAGGG